MENGYKFQDKEIPWLFHAVFNKLQQERGRVKSKVVKLETDG